MIRGVTESAHDWPRILTARLLLRRFEERDLSALLAYRNDSRVEPWQGWGLHDEERGAKLLASFISRGFGVPGETRSAQVAFELRETGLLIGDSMLRIDADDPTRAVIGYTIAPGHQRRGLAREGVSALLAYAVPKLGLRRVEAFTLPDNVASIALLRSLGFEDAPGAPPDEVGFGLDVSSWKA